jgi:hypothetical protein
MTNGPADHAAGDKEALAYSPLKPVACTPLLAGTGRRRRRIASVAELRAAANHDRDRQIEIGAQGPGPDRTKERDVAFNSISSRAVS